MKNEKAVVIIVAAVSIIVIMMMIWRAIKPVLVGMNIIRSDDEKEMDKLDARLVKNAFDPNFWRSYPNVQPQSELTYSNLARVIYDSKGALWDDEKAALAAIKQMTRKYDVSKLSDVFARTYNSDLQQYLKSFMENDWQIGDNYYVQVLRYVENLRDY